MRLCIGPRAQHRQPDVPEVAVMLELSPSPGGEHDGFGLLKARLGLVVVDAVALVVVDVVGGAAAQTDNQPALADIVDKRELLGHADRVVQRHLRDREADLDPLGAEWKPARRRRTPGRRSAQMPSK